MIRRRAKKHAEVAKVYRDARGALMDRVCDLAKDHDDTSDDLGVVAGNHTAVESLPWSGSSTASLG